MSLAIHSLDPCVEVDESVDPLECRSSFQINEEQVFNEYYLSLTPCSSTLTLTPNIQEQQNQQEYQQQEYQQQGEQQGEDNQQTITLVLPDFSTRFSVNFNHLLSYIQSKTQTISSQSPPIHPHDISMHHLILYLFECVYPEKLAHASPYCPPITYINQLKLLSMGKAYHITNAVDVSYPPSLLSSFLLLPILQRCQYVQLIVIPPSNILPFEMPTNTILTKLVNIQVAQSVGCAAHSVNTNASLTISDYSVTYAEAMVKKFKRVRHSISSSSSSEGTRRPSQSSESTNSSSCRVRSQSLPVSQVSRIHSHTGSDTDVDEAKGSKSKIGFKNIFSKQRKKYKSKSVGGMVV